MNLEGSVKLLGDNTKLKQSNIESFPESASNLFQRDIELLARCCEEIDTKVCFKDGKLDNITSHLNAMSSKQTQSDLSSIEH